MYISILHCCTIFRMVKNLEGETKMKLSVSNNKFSRYELFRFRHATMAIADNIGFASANSSAINSLSFLLRTYFEQLCRDSLNSAINSGRSEVSLEDVSHVFCANGINITELHDYIQQVQPYTPADELPLFPVVEPLNVPLPTEIADSAERKDVEGETTGNDGVDMDVEANKDQNNKQSANSFNSRSNARNAIYQKIFPKFAGAFAPDLGFSVRKIELPTENVSVGQQLANILPHPSETVQHTMYEFDRSVAQPLRTKAAISEEQERLMKKKRKKEKREKEKRMSEKSAEKRTDEGKRKKHKLKEQPKDERTDQTSPLLQPPPFLPDERTVTSPPPQQETLKIPKLKIRMSSIPQQLPPSPPPLVDEETATIEKPIVSMVKDIFQRPSPVLPVDETTTTTKTSTKMTMETPTTTSVATAISVSKKVEAPKVTKTVTEATVQQSTPVASTTTSTVSMPKDIPQRPLSALPVDEATTVNAKPIMSKDKPQSPALFSVTSSGRSAKPFKRKFEEAKTEKPMATKGQTKPKSAPKAAKITPSSSKMSKTPIFPTTGRNNNSAEKVKAIAKAVEQIAAAHFSATPLTKPSVENVVKAVNDDDEEDEPIWICPTCSVAYVEGQEMVACDDCDRWYHWGCVGILIPPPEKAQWYCSECRRKRKKTAQQQTPSGGGGGSGSNSRKSSFSGSSVAPVKKQRIAKA